MEAFLDYIPIVVALGMIGVVVANMWRFSQAASQLQRWAEHFDYTLIRQENHSTRRQNIYYVVVRDTRKGTVWWVQCGYWENGVFRNAIKVEWDMVEPSAS